MKTEIWYILHHEGTGFIASVSTTRRGVISDTILNLRQHREKLTWNDLKKRGYSVQKVSIVPILRKGQE